MGAETWKLGDSLDALNDMLHGGYGALAGAGSATIIWRDMALCREALGVEASLRFLEERQTIWSQFNGKPIASPIRMLQAGQGETYFDVVMQVFADHPSIAIIEP